MSNARPLASLKRELRRAADPRRARSYQRFFKTAPGEYGHGDVFLGVTVPVLRAASRRHRQLSLTDTETLLRSRFHEERLTALFILVLKCSAADGTERKPVYDLYVRNLTYVNNWDLVDASAEHIVGGYLAGKRRRPLYRWARSKSLWTRRIAIMATFHDIKRGQFTDTLRIAKLLLHDQEDLIHKAVGWMLREVGKRDLAVEEAFLRRHHSKMPRTMLRYAIERFPTKKRIAYLEGHV